MRSFMYTIKVPTGMHARHAGMLVKEIGQYQSAVTFTKDDRSVDARRILALMGLGVKQGDLIRIKFADGSADCRVEKTATEEVE